MTRHAVDAALLEVGPSPTDGRRVDTRRVHVQDPYVRAKMQLLAAVAEANDVRVVWYSNLGIANLVGVRADVAAVELLFTSLLLQVGPAPCRPPNARRDAGRRPGRSAGRSCSATRTGSANGCRPPRRRATAEAAAEHERRPAPGPAQPPGGGRGRGSPSSFRACAPPAPGVHRGVRFDARRRRHDGRAGRRDGTDVGLRRSPARRLTRASGARRRLRGSGAPRRSRLPVPATAGTAAVPPLPRDEPADNPGRELRLGPHPAHPRVRPRRARASRSSGPARRRRCRRSSPAATPSPSCRPAPARRRSTRSPGSSSTARSSSSRR